MTDMRKFIEPKSDQMNADDLIGGTRTITVSKVVETGSKEQPIAIYFDGDKGKPYKPGKSMMRVLVELWGTDGNKYVGESMILYRDPDVKFGSEEVGGIRISHMTGIDREQRIPLTVTRGKKKPHVVKPMQMGGVPAGPSKPKPEATIDDARAGLKTAADLAELERRWGHARMAPFRDDLQAEYDARHTELTPTGGDAGGNEDWNV